MDRTKTIAALVLVPVLMLMLITTGCSTTSPAIKVGSKNFTEQVLLGEIIAQHLEHRLHQKVERRLNLGGTLLAHQALLAGELDLYPEYTGTALSAVLKEPIQNDTDAVLKRVKAEYQRKFQVAWFDPLGINNSFAMVVRGDVARAQHLETLSDAAKAPKWALGVGYEFEQRADGLAALNAAYHLPWAGSAKNMDLGLLYKALELKQVSMIAANQTDGLLSKMDLKTLDDDQHAFPPYQLCIAVREDALRKTSQLPAALQELSGAFTNTKMRELNFQVDGRHRPVAEVAAEFLKGIEK